MTSPSSTLSPGPSHSPSGAAFPRTELTIGELGLSEVGGGLYDALRPIADPYDRPRGFPLAAYADGIGLMLQPILDLVKNPDIYVDPDETPDDWVPWLGQFVGAGVPAAGSGDVTADRAAIKNPPRRRRGTVLALVEEVQAFLNPPRSVYVLERVGGVWAQGTLTILAGQRKAGVTVAQIQDRVNAVKPAGRQILVSEISGGDWLSVRDTHTDWLDVRSTFTDWAEVRSNPTKQ